MRDAARRDGDTRDTRRTTRDAHCVVCAYACAHLGGVPAIRSDSYGQIFFGGAHEID
jgi:hypothetical protein